MGTVNSLQRDELKGAFVSFIPAATVIGGTPVAIDSWPSSASDYNDWRFKDTETVKRERKVTDRTRQVPRESGGYEEQTKKSLRGLSFICTTVQTNSILKQLENGLSAPAVAGVPQIPMEDRQADMLGVALIEMVDEDTKQVAEAWQFWARLTLDTPSDAGPEVSALTYRLELIEADLNTYQAN